MSISYWSSFAPRHRCFQFKLSMNDLLKYSFQYNVKIIGFPERDEHESSETTTQLCLKLFHAIGAEGVTKNDIDIAHRVNS